MIQRFINHSILFSGTFWSIYVFWELMIFLFIYKAGSAVHSDSVQLIGTSNSRFKKRLNNKCVTRGRNQTCLTQSRKPKVGHIVMLQNHFVLSSIVLLSFVSET